MLKLSASAPRWIEGKNSEPPDNRRSAKDPDFVFLCDLCDSCANFAVKGFFYRKLAIANAAKKIRKAREEIRESLGLFLGRQFEVDGAAPEPLRLPRAERDAEQHPCSTHDPRIAAQAPPEPQANQETEDRRQEVRNLLFRFAHEVAHEGRRIHAHERDQSAKIQ